MDNNHHYWDENTENLSGPDMDAWITANQLNDVLIIDGLPRPVLYPRSYLDKAPHVRVSRGNAATAALEGALLRVARDIYQETPGDGNVTQVMGDVVLYDGYTLVVSITEGSIRYVDKLCTPAGRCIRMRE